jgi:hypothetical protein
MTDVGLLLFASLVLTRYQDIQFLFYRHDSVILPSLG